MLEIQTFINTLFFSETWWHPV